MQKYERAYESIERPFAWIDLDYLDANIDYVNASCGAKGVRIATKSIRSLPLLQYIERKLQRFVGYMTFTAAETVYLLEHGLNDILLGYPVYERQSMTRIAQHVKAGANVTFMVDHVKQLELLNAIAAREQVQLQICIDLNMSTNYPLLYFGTKRSPLQNLDKVDAFLKAIEKFPHIVVAGAMGYDAQIAGVADTTSEALGLKGALIRKLKAHSLPKLTKFRQQAVAHIRHYHPLQFVNAGGSGSMTLLKDAKDITEITVGSAFFAPALFDHYTTLKLKPAAGFGLRVTRKFAEQIIVCHGGGYIASGATNKDRSPVFLEPNDYSFTSLEGAGEVQTPIIVKNRKHAIGDTIYFRHAKAGELCERFQVLHGSRNGEYVGPYKTYRGDEQCFL
mgnify:CR=1 FL=1